MLNAHALYDAARQVNGHIAPIEEALDDTFSKTAGFLAYLPQARTAANLPMATGHKAMMRVLASLNAIAQARDEMIAAHEAFATTRSDLRLPETGMGSLVPCPATGQLRAVGSVAA